MQAEQTYFHCAVIRDFKSKRSDLYACCFCFPAVNCLWHPNTVFSLRVSSPELHKNLFSYLPQGISSHTEIIWFRDICLCHLCCDHNSQVNFIYIDNKAPNRKNHTLASEKFAIHTHTKTVKKGRNLHREAEVDL